MPKVFTSEKQKTGKLGEEIACKYLLKHGYDILETNYTKKYGEIDIIAIKNNILHFIEVKSIVSRETNENVTRETYKYDPLQNVHPQKIRRLMRVIQVYLVSRQTQKNSMLNNCDWQFDIAVVYIDSINKIGKVKFNQNIII